MLYEVITGNPKRHRRRQDAPQSQRLAAGEERRSVLEPAGVVGEALQLLRSTLPATVRFAVDIDPDAVRCRRSGPATNRWARRTSRAQRASRIRAGTPAPRIRHRNNFV